MPSVWALVVELSESAVRLEASTPSIGAVTTFAQAERLAAVRAGASHWIEYTLKDRSGSTLGHGDFEVPLHAIAEPGTGDRGPAIVKIAKQIALVAVPFTADLATVEFNRVVPGAGGVGIWPRVAIGRVSIRPYGGPGPVAGPPVQLHASSSAGALNAVIVGDGFTASAASIGAYRAAADALAQRLMATPPFRAHLDDFSIWRVDVASAEAGITVPAGCGPYPYDPPQKYSLARSAKDPAHALGTHWCAADLASVPRGNFLDGDRALALKFALTAGVMPTVTFVIVNDWMFGATAWPDSGIAYVSIGQNLTGDVNPQSGALLQPNIPQAFPGVTTHEIGHLTPFYLLDEYGGSDVLDREARAIVNASPNLVASDALHPIKWQSLVNAPIPTARDAGCAVAAQRVQPNDVGAYENGYAIQCGVFHAQLNCKMNQTDPAFATPLCVVCSRQIASKLASLKKTTGGR